jgi:hypothetical protein
MVRERYCATLAKGNAGWNYSQLFYYQIHTWTAVDRDGRKQDDLALLSQGLWKTSVENGGQKW